PRGTSKWGPLGHQLHVGENPCSLDPPAKAGRRGPTPAPTLDRSRPQRMKARSVRVSACLTIAAFALVAARLAFGAGTPETPTRVTLASAIATFRQRSFDLLIAEIGIDAARADERAAGAVANPNLGVSVGKSFTYDASCAGCSDVPWSAALSDQGA